MTKQKAKEFARLKRELARIENQLKNLFKEHELEEESEEESSDDESWLREQAMLAGMRGGTQAYNEVMGVDIEEEEEHGHQCVYRGCWCLDD